MNRHQLFCPPNFNFRNSRFGLVLSLLSLTFVLNGQTTVNLTSVKDCTIFAGNTTGSNGAGSLYAGRTGGTNGTLQRRSLIKFDLSSIPDNAIVSSATFSLTGSRGGPDPFTVHRLTKDWGEGSTTGQGNGGGRPSTGQTGDATWTSNFLNTSNWTNPGGDFVGTASDNGTIQNNATTQFNSADIVSDVQAWINGSAANHGWIVIGDEGSLGTAVRMNAKETNIDVPSLSITYTLPAGIAIINEVNPVGQWVELYNPTSSSVDVSNWWLCNDPQYDRIGTLTVLSGSTTMAAGTYLVLSWSDISQDDGEVGLYTTDASNFTDDIVDYVIYGNPNPTRAAVAVGAGVWDAESNRLIFPEGNNSLGLKTGIYMSGMDSDSDDWEEQDPTQGVVNPDCAAVLRLNGPIPAGTYEASQKIIATGTLAAGSNVVFKTGNVANLDSLFQIDLTGTLEITVENCN